MIFAVMELKAPNVKGVFGIVDADSTNPTLPQIEGAYWSELRRIDESRAPFADAAKKAIAERGYYLIGGEVRLTEGNG